MFTIGRYAGVSLAVLALAFPAAAQDTAPTRDEMWQIIQQQQQTIDELRRRVDQQEGKIDQAEELIAETDEKIEATGELVESSLIEGGAGGGWWNNTQLGGYGEVHYNGGKTDKVDIHRFVVFLGHDFTDRIRFAGELEVEHALAGEGKPGEVEVEQAFIEYDFADNAAARAGVFLIPVGFLNETHEPPTYYGVERNKVEANIIPTTWWEAGAGLAGRLGQGLSYDLSAHSGLAVKSDYKIRGGRQKVANAEAKNAAFTGRIRWTGMPGVEVGATGQYQTDLTQDGYKDGTDTGISATLMEGHVGVTRGMFGLRALYARWDLDGGSAAHGPAAVGADEQWGWFVEPSVRFDVGGIDMGLFARYSMTDNQAGNSDDTELEWYDFGTNVWLHEDVVLKLDYSIQKQEGKDDTGTLNLGVGFQF